MNDNHIILVISRTPGLAAITREAVQNAVEVDYASNRSAALEKVRTGRPEIVILGQPEPPDTAAGLYRELREGWISRHSSLLVIEQNAAGDSCRILTDENLEARIGGYTFIPGSAAPFFPPADLASILREKIKHFLEAGTNVLKASILDPRDFCVTWEQIPGLGAFESRQELVLENARKAARGNKVCAVSIVDNPGGNPAIATEILCSEIRKLGIEPMVHLAFRDKSRNQVESLLYQLAALDIHNLLILTGDYPSKTGFQGMSRPVFDLDSVNGLQLIAEMNRGMEQETRQKKTRLAPTKFFAGVAVSPFKQEEAEVMGQYYKLKKKIEAGADFVITQIGYDFRKLHELQLWLKAGGYRIPVLISIQVLTYPTAKAMHDNRVPGCVVTDKLLEQIAGESRSADKGRQARLDRAARMYAAARGMGFAGACISGQNVPYESVEYIIEKGREMAGRWPDFLPEFDYPQENGFYYFTNTSISIPAEAGIQPAPRRQKPLRPLIFFLSRAVHAAVFEPRSPLFKLMRPLLRSIDSSPVLGKVFGAVEFWAKAVLYGCQNCGDCALFDAAYLCPVSQCPKNQRNGPCGGSYYGWCEVYPDEKKCIWVRAYLRLKGQKKEDSIGEFIVPACNWALWQSSSWLNYFTGRDHVSQRMGIKPEKDSSPGGK